MYEGPVQDLIDELGKLPGVGPKSAQRIAFHLLSVEPPEIDRLQAALQKVRDGVQFCEVCGTVSDREQCRICADSRRDRTQICVVEEPKDVQAIERTREFRGRYHVLGGALDPLNGVGPDQLNIRALLMRIGNQEDGVDVSEVIIATDPNTEGEQRRRIWFGCCVTSRGWRSRGWRRGCRWVATSSSPTSSRWVAQCPEGGRCDR